MIRCASFDVFDTCLTRRLGAPSEVFRLVGRDLARRAGGPDPDDFTGQFVAWRIEAELRARRASEREEVTLAEIWAQLLRMLPATLPAEDGPALEQECEREVLVPVETARARVNHEREAGRHVIFVSDTYLPLDFVRSCLRDHGLLQEGDGLYVSSATGGTKRTGTLFRQVIAGEGIAPAEIRHIGDNPASDVESARRCGLQAELVSLAAPVVQSAAPEATAQAAADAVRSARLTASAHVAGAAAAPATALVVSFLGPFLCIFAYWLLARARRDGTTRLFFASRDSRLLWSVCRQLAAAEGLAIDCRYLMISREALLLPAVTHPSRESLAWVRRDFEEATLPRLLGKVGLVYADIAAGWEKEFPAWRPRDALSTPRHWTSFWSLVLAPELATRIQSDAAQRRQSALAYLRKAGALDEVPAALVDLGWFLTCQGALNTLRSSAGTTPLRGYYFMLKQHRLGPAEAGPASAILYEPAVDAPRSSAITRLAHRETLLEHIVGLADHPSVMGYESDGTVRFSQPALPSSQKQSFRAVESGLRAYVTGQGPHWRALADTAQAPDALAYLVGDFFLHPDPRTYAVVRNIPVTADQDRRILQPLVSGYGWHDIAPMLLPRALTRHLSPRHPGRLWPEAAWAETPAVRRKFMLVGWLLQRLYNRCGCN